jgi:hypothetical protein
MEVPIDFVIRLGARPIPLCSALTRNDDWHLRFAASRTEHDT